ncbi:MAG TPA: (d)CMP kinase [Bauldia sp.]|nr:(d)CMP kinase [Bauldia sp.]
MIIAIDGPAAAGKGTLAARLARHFGLPHLDTGLLYRAVGKRVADRGLDPDNPEHAGREAARLEPAELQNPALRGHEAGELASRVAVHSEVRRALLAFQRDFARRREGAVLDGRDIGTAVVPDADIKIYVTATPEVRARRRTDELRAKGRDVAYDRILAEIVARDARDAGRAAAPLSVAADAVVIDTSALDAEAVFRQAVALVEARRKGGVQAPVSPGGVFG